MTGARRCQAGLVRGCCLLGILLVALLAGAAFVADRALAAPELGGAPRGPDDGDSQAAIAVSLGAQLAAELLAQPHATVTLSEHDLTVLAAAHNPNPGSLSAIAVRVRSGYVVVAGQHPVGPLSTTVVGRLSLTLDITRSPPALSTQVEELDVGQLGLPGFIRDRVLGNFASTIDLDELFNGSPALQAVRANLECVVVTAGGVRIGVHRPGTSPDPGTCGS